MPAGVGDCGKGMSGEKKKVGGKFLCNFFKTVTFIFASFIVYHIVSGSSEQRICPY